MRGGFFRAVDSDEDEGYSSEEEQKPTATKRPQFQYDSDDESEDEKRVAKSQKDRRWEAMQNISKRIKQHCRINDFVSLYNDYDDLKREILRSQGLIEQQGTPIFCIRSLVRLDDSVQQVSKEEEKKLNTNNKKSYSRLKQQLRKFLKDYEQELENFRANPVESEPSDVEDEEDDDEEEGDEEDDDSDWGSGSESEEDDDKGYDPNNRRSFWVIKDRGQGQKESKKPKVKAQRQKEELKDLKQIGDESKDYSNLAIATKLKEIMKTWGRIGVDNKALILDLTDMRNNCQDKALLVQILGLLVQTIFNTWENSPNVVMAEVDSKEALISMNMLTDFYQKRPDLFQPENRAQTFTSFVSNLERLNEELKKRLRSFTTVNMQYSRHLQGFIDISQFLNKLEGMLQETDDKKGLTRLAILRLDMIYYIHRGLVAKMKEAYKGDKLGLYFQVEDPVAEVEHICKGIYQDGNHMQQTIAVLMQIFNMSLHGEFDQAYRMLIIGGPSEKQLREASVQVLYNRAIVQLGLAAFYNGQYLQCLKLLNDIVATHKISELLAQSFSSDKSKGAKREEQRRLLPPHMHINPNLVEAAYIISCMLVDIPIMAANPLDPYSKTHSISFIKFLEFYSRQSFGSPAETHRDYVYLASRELQKGNWERASKKILKLDVWKYVPEDIEFKSKLQRKIKESSMISFISTYGESYATLTKSQLSRLFEIPELDVYRLISRLILQGQFQGAWDGDILLVFRSWPSQVEFLSLQLADKINVCLDNNETLLEKRGILGKLRIGE